MSKPYYGGQAVIEGVMMAGPKGKAIAVRNEDGDIIYKIDDIHAPSERYPLLGKPLIRGVVNFARSMVSGIKDLTWSAAQAGETEDENLSTWSIVGAVVTALVFTVIVFIIIPVFAGTYLHQYIGDFGRSLFEGALRAALFLGYVLLISRLNDIRRVFAYHGAEHKTINAFEAGAPLTPESVNGFSRIHVRCGTSFILMAMLLMIIVFTFVGQTTAVYRILIKIVLLPIIAGLAYELFRLPLRFPDSRLVKILVAPGLAMQSLTTRDPDLGQIEVAIAALKAVPGFADSEISAAGKKAAAARAGQAAAIIASQQQAAITRGVTEATEATLIFDAQQLAEIAAATVGAQSAAEQTSAAPAATAAPLFEPAPEAKEASVAPEAITERQKDRQEQSSTPEEKPREDAAAAANAAIVPAANTEEVLEPAYEPRGATLQEKAADVAAAAAAKLSVAGAAVAQSSRRAARKTADAAQEAAARLAAAAAEAKEKSRPWREKISAQLKQAGREIADNAVELAEEAKEKITELIDKNIKKRK